MPDLTRCYPDRAALAREQADFARWVSTLHDWVAPGGESAHPLDGVNPVNCTIYRCTRCRARWPALWGPMPATPCTVDEAARCSFCRQPAPGELRDFWGDLRCADCRIAGKVWP